MSTLKQYWNDEVTRIGTALSTQQARVATLRSDLQTAESSQRAAALDLRNQSDAVEAARRALAAIAMPADGDPLLAAMASALTALHNTQATLATSELAVQGLRAELARQEKQAAALTAAKSDAQAMLKTETANADARKKITDMLSPGGALETLATDADAVLTASEATARSRVESEFPSSGTDSKDFLKRVRARRKLVEDSAKAAAGTEGTASNAHNTDLALAQRTFDQAVSAVSGIISAAALLSSDSATLARLAALSAPVPPDSYPILTRWQHDALHNSSKKNDREAALAKLTAVDEARAEVITAQRDYDEAFHAAMKSDPDKTEAQLDAMASVSAKKTILGNKQGALTAARAALSTGERTTLDEWFAAVPDALWDALDNLDTVTARLKYLKGPPSATDLITAMDNAEAALVTELDAARLAERKAEGARLALKRAGGAATAERETTLQRARAFARSSALF